MRREVQQDARGQGRAMSLATAVTGAREWKFDLAGPDDLLARACRDLKAGQWWVAQESLDTCADFDTRARRSELLAAVAARGDTDGYWLSEQPDNRHARLLAARAAVLRVKRASAEIRPALIPKAEELCHRAAEADPADPTPWIALLILRALGARADRTLTITEGWTKFAALRRYRSDQPWGETVANLMAGPGPAQPGIAQQRHAQQILYGGAAIPETPIVGPWDVLFELWSRHPHSREGNLRFLDALRVEDAKLFAQLASQIAPPDSLLQMLPLSANLAEYRYRVERDGSVLAKESLAQRVWEDPQLRNVAVNLYEYWFLPRLTIRAPVEIGAYSLLAHALVMTPGKDAVEERDLRGWRDRDDRQSRRAADVMAAMRPYASTYPWSVTAPGGNGRQAFTKVAAELGVAPI